MFYDLTQYVPSVVMTTALNLEVVPQAPGFQAPEFRTSKKTRVLQNRRPNMTPQQRTVGLLLFPSGLVWTRARRDGSICWWSTLVMKCCSNTTILDWKDIFAGPREPVLSSAGKVKTFCDVTKRKLFEIPSRFLCHLLHLTPPDKQQIFGSLLQLGCSLVTQ